MPNRFLVVFGFTLTLLDQCFVTGFINHRILHIWIEDNKAFKRVTSRNEQKKQTPIAGDFNELGSSLITLLNLAQEIGSSNNVRFRQAADKLRDQFARSFALRYDLEKSQFLSAALASIDGDSEFTPG
jgi:hypothetical protein